MSCRSGWRARPVHDRLRFSHACRDFDGFAVRDAMMSLRDRRAGQDLVATKAAAGTFVPCGRKEGASMAFANRPPDSPDRLVFHLSFPAFGGQAPS